jgi:hypothetical protein
LPELSYGAFLIDEFHDSCICRPAIPISHARNAPWLNAPNDSAWFDYAMNRTATIFVSVVALALVLLPGTSALGAPPSVAASRSNLWSVVSTTASDFSVSTAASMSGKKDERLLKLDLRLPEVMEENQYRDSRAFPAHPSSGTEIPDLPNLGSSKVDQNRSHAEELARRVRQEGLPIARLWQNQSTLLSIGLNQKGKPGLWLLKKIH